MARGRTLIQKSYSKGEEYDPPVPLVFKLFQKSEDQNLQLLWFQDAIGVQREGQTIALKLEAKDIVILIVVTMFLFCVIFSEKLLAFCKIDFLW